MRSRIEASRFIPVAIATALILTGCKFDLTTPLPTEKILYLAVGQSVLDQCSTVDVSGLPPKNQLPFSIIIPVPGTAYANARQPEHIGLKKDGYIRTAVVTNEYTGGPLIQTVKLKRPGAYVFKSRPAAGEGPYKFKLTCDKVAQSFEVTVGGNFSTDVDTPIVLNITENMNTSVMATLKEYPKGSSPDQLNLP